MSPRRFMKNKNEILENCNKARPEQEYTHLQELIDNLPYLFMMLLGALVFVLGPEASAFNWLFAGLYVFYGMDYHLCVSLLPLL